MNSDPSTNPTEPFNRPSVGKELLDELMALAIEEPDEHSIVQECIGGRFRILSELGRGGFGLVLLAEDELLKRQVAVKLVRGNLRMGKNPMRDDVSSLNEARAIAKLEHPGIVPIYDIAEAEAGGYCIIYQYVDGKTLRGFLNDHKPSFAETCSIMIALCETLNHAHGLGIVHRDVKPTNIMIGSDGRPMLLDFGLAKAEADVSPGGLAAGTPGYMSPEQARGEDHLVRGRSDIFSLGAVFYEMLCGRLAFDSRDVVKHLELVESGDVVEPRTVDHSVPRQLERICLKAMQSTIRLRYPLASDVAEDLQAWLALQGDGETATFVGGGGSAGDLTIRSGLGEIPVTGFETTAAPRIVPRGLRSFDDSDADFFLSLLAGPRDRFGLPESIRFWKKRIESKDEQAAFRVGVIYGPSGCGKSSLVRAGLLPRCGGHVDCLYYEARDSRNAQRLGRAVAAKFPQLPDQEASVVDLVRSLRRGAELPDDSKLLLVIDQAEQWLREVERADDPSDEHGLLNLLRQCDGARIQILLLVRDDFWQGVSRLFAQADVELDSNNSAMVELFDSRHSEKVLESFGRAYGCLPDDPSVGLSAAQKNFIKESVSSLEEGRRISPVRLALFAEMFRDRSWTVAELHRVGGVGGVAVTFLRESFDGAEVRGPQRTHQQAARRVLELLVPESGTVRGPARLESEMLAISGYEQRPKAFAKLMHVLDKDLRLITPVESTSGANGDSRPAWQITHDYMVSALREWLLARKKETVRGRAEFALQERACEWQERREARRLPGIWEWMRLRWYTKRGEWSPIEAQWMRTGMVHVRRWGIGVLALLAVLAGVIHVVRGREHGGELAQRVLTYSSGQVQSHVSTGGRWMKWARPKLELAAQESAETLPGLNARLALVSTHPAFAETLVEQMLDADAATFGAIRDALENVPDVSLEPISAVLAAEMGAEGRRFRAYAAMASFGGRAADMDRYHSKAANWLIGSMNEIAAWAALLRPVQAEIGDELTAIINVGSDHSESEQRAATVALTGLYRNSPEHLIGLLALFPSEAVPLVVNPLRSLPEAELRALFGRIEIPELIRNRQDSAPPTVLSDEDERTYVGYANGLLAEVALVRQDRLIGHLTREADRTLRTLLIVNNSRVGVSPDVLATLLLDESDPGVRQALLLMLCGHPVSQLSLSNQEKVLPWLPTAYVNDPDGGVHSSIAALSKRWSLDAELDALNKSLPRTSRPEPGKRWWITPTGIDMRIVTSDKGRQVAISATEVTISEYLKYSDAPKFREMEKEGDGMLPANRVDWKMAAQYCNRLSAAEGFGVEEWCYREGEELEVARGLKGYRLPSSLEFRDCTRPSGIGCWYLGSSVGNLDHYAWNSENSSLKPTPVAGLFPDELGLWDTLGNAMEWSHELRTSAKPTAEFLGYSYQYDRHFFTNPSGFWSGVENPRDDGGFRLARTIVPQ